MVWSKVAVLGRKVLACLLVVGVLLFVWGLGSSRFRGVEGEHTFYLYSPSSQATQKKELSFWAIGSVKGESVAVKEGSAEEWIARLQAKVLFTESVGERCSYYCFTPKWSEGIYIGEYYVNVQVVEGQEGCVLGAPIIFGGF